MKHENEEVRENAQYTKAKAKGRRVPRLRFPEFVESKEWDEDKIGSVFEYGATSNNARADLSQTGDTYYIHYGDIHTKFNTYIDFSRDDIPKINSVLLKRTTLLKNGDLILADASEDTEGIGKSIEVRNLDPNTTAVAGLHTLLLREKSETYVEGFRGRLREIETVKVQIERIAAGSKVYAISKHMLQDITVPIPSKQEQRKIVACLSSLDEIISAHERKLEALADYKKGLMQRLFPTEGRSMPRLRFKEFRDAGIWGKKEIGEVFQVTRGYVLPMTIVSDNYAKETPYPVYSSQTKNKGLAGYYSDYLYEDAITWTTDGANAGDVNYRPGRFYCTNVCGVLLNSEGYANKCVAELINAVSKKHVSYVGNPKLMNGVMSKIEIRLPNVSEQRKIASTLSSLDDLIAAEKRKIEELKEHKRGLMQGLFPVPEEDE